MPTYTISRWPPIPASHRSPAISGGMTQRAELIRKMQQEKWDYVKLVLANWIALRTVKVIEQSRLLEMSAETRQEIQSQVAIGILFDEVSTQRVQMGSVPVPDTNPASPTKWYFEAMNLRVAREAKRVGRGKGVTVAMLDSGIDTSHKELVKKPIRQVQVSSGGRVTRIRKAGDQLGHGTYVAGLIAGRTTGIAPDSNLLCARVLSSRGDATTASIVAGWEWILKQPEVRVIVVCLGMDYRPQEASLWQSLVTASLQCQVLPVIAAGNSGPANLILPGGTSGGLVVGASTHSESVAPFSGSGTLKSGKRRLQVPNLVAPGENIRSILPGDEYTVWTGTTPATAIVGGVAALVWEQNPDSTAEQIRDTVLRSCHKLSDPPERQGRGLIRFEVTP